MTDYRKNHAPCGHFHRHYVEVVNPGPGPVPPIEGGATLLYYSNNGRELFSVMPLSGGYLVGDYGLTRDGAQIGFLSGSSLSVESKPSPPRESFMDIILASDGNPVSATEHYGSIYKRSGAGASGTWSLKYSMSQPVLMMFLSNIGGTLYSNWYDFSSQTSGLVSSGNNGENWSNIASYSFRVFCLCDDGSNLYLTGSSGAYPVLANAGGSVLCSNGDKSGWSYWGCYSEGGVTNMGSYSLMYQKNGQQGFIDAWDGATRTTVLNTAQPYVHVITAHGGKRYAVSTNAWDADGNSYIYASSDGYSWRQVSHVPCGYIIGHWAADDGLYLVGGKYGSYGALYRYNY